MSDLITAFGYTLITNQNPKILTPIEIPYPEILQELIEYSQSIENQTDKKVNT